MEVDKISYKRRKGWWEEYGLYIRKSPVRDIWILGFGGFGKRAGGPVWEFDSQEEAEHAVEEAVDGYLSDDFAAFAMGVFDDFAERG